VPGGDGRPDRDMADLAAQVAHLAHAVVLGAAATGFVILGTSLGYA